MLLCLPIGCLKGWIFIGSILTILISIGLLTLTIYSNIQKKNIISDADKDMTTKFFAGMYVSSILLLLMGLAGLYGSLKKNKILLGLFTIGTCIFVALFLAGMLLFFIGPKTLFDGTCQAPKNGWLIDLRETTNLAQRILCTADCPCKWTREDWIPDWEGFVNDTETGQVRVNDCPIFQTAEKPETDVIMMETFEKEFVCGGWCPETDNSRIFYFTNVNNQGPNESCYDALEDFFKKYGTILGIGCSAAFGVALLNVIMICCFCFHPSKARNNKRLFTNLLEDQ